MASKLAYAPAAMNGLALAAALAMTQAPVAEPEAVATARPERSRAASTSTPPRPARAQAASDDAADAERTARAFLEALARGDATGLAQMAADRFSFDGEIQTGREAIRRTWRDLLVARPPAAPPALGALEVLHAPDAQARFGKPPSRLAPLVRQGVTIAIGDVGGRTVVLFVARENGRMAVLGMHD
jgi:hypothetical protein